VSNGYQPHIYREQGGQRQVIKAGGSLRDEQPVSGAYPAVVFQHDYEFAHVVGAAAETQNITMPDGIDVIDAHAIKGTLGGSATTGGLTVQVQTSTGGAISNAISVAIVANTIGRAGTLNSALASIARGGVLRAVRAGGNGATAAGKNIGFTLRVLGVKRGT
jgi:hypothetical protein